MAEPHPRFAKFIHDCAAELCAQPPNVLEDKYMFKVGDRWVELIYDRAGDHVTFASISSLRAPDATIRSDLIASFNFHQLFTDGLAMVVVQGALIYMCLTFRLTALDFREIRARLEAFHMQVEAGSAWLAIQSEVSGGDDAHASHGSSAFEGRI